MSALFDSARAAAAEGLPALLSHVWSSTLFLLAVLAVLFTLGRRWSGGARYALTLVGLAKFAVPDALVGAALRSLAEPLGSRGAFEVPLGFVAGALEVDFVPAPARLWPALVLALWGAVALALLLRLALAHLRLARLARSARSARELLPARPHEIEAFERARRRLGFRPPLRSLEIVRSALPGAPAVLGIRRPRIVLPLTGCDSLSGDELEALLCHECAHVVRRDNLAAAAVSALAALFWFHPLVWVARRVLGIERERACDEIAAGSGGRGEIYLSALAKFCHAAIGSQLPGMSRMATSHLKERMDHVMRHASRESRSPSSARVTLVAGAALALFTLAAGFVGERQVLAAGSPDPGSTPYSIRIGASRDAAGFTTVETVIRDNATQAVLASPRLKLDASREGGFQMSTPEKGRVVVSTRPDGAERIAVDVTIEKAGKVVEKQTLFVTPGTRHPTAPSGEKRFTGDPIDIVLTNANLREVLTTFGQISGLEMKIADGVEGKVSVTWSNTPWDEAFDSLCREQGLAYRIEGKTIHVSKR